MKVALLQLNARIGDFDDNATKLLSGYRQAVQRGAALVVAPELYLCGYPPRDLLLAEEFCDDADRALAAVAADIGAVPLVVGAPTRRNESGGRPLFNSAVVLQDGNERLRVHKQLLPSYDVFEEDRYFEPGPATQVWEFAGRRIGITVCEDIWNDADYWPQTRYRTDPVRELGRQGMDLLINVSASPWQVGKHHVRRQMIRSAAQREKVAVVHCNLVGGNDELIFDGHSLVMDGDGQVLCYGRGFEEDILLVDLDNSAPAVERAHSDEEDLFAALSLGTRDYVRKCGFDGVIIGLSGGIDSALTAAIAVDALGPDKVTGVLMPGPYSSEGSITDAEALARVLEISHVTLPVTAPYETLLGQLRPTFENRPADLTEENLQARLRGITLMALSNKLGRLVLTTGNKSELAVGYCTLYGDMCGGLAVINDVPKTWVYKLARWINRHTEIIPWNTIEKPPSAELRPDQTDQDSLPPYDVLDAILDHYIIHHRSAEEIARHCGLEPQLVRSILRKVDMNEYKRRQAAPGLKVTSRAFGMGRRMPIARKISA